MGDQVEVASYKYTGFVYDVTDGKYGIDIKCKTVKDESTVKWSQHIMFTIGTKGKAYDAVKGLGIGKMDKIEVEFIPSLIEGVSKTTNKAYAMMKNNITSVKILEKASPEEVAAEDSVDDMPF